jgi:hypothetical protein
MAVVILARAAFPSGWRFLLNHTVPHGRRASTGLMAQIPFGLEPVCQLVAGLPAARLAECVGANRHFRVVLFFEHEDQTASIEMSEPLLPADGSKGSESRKVEPQAAAAIIHRECCRARLRCIAGRRLGLMVHCPAADLAMVTARVRPHAGTFGRSLSRGPGKANGC